MVDLAGMVQPRYCLHCQPYLISRLLKTVGRHRTSVYFSQLLMDQQRKLQGLDCKSSKYEINDLQ